MSLSLPKIETPTKQGDHPASENRLNAIFSKTRQTRSYSELLDDIEDQECLLRDLFHTFDVNHNGRIEESELHDLLRLVRLTRATEHRDGMALTHTAREHDEEMLRKLPQLVPHYTKRYGINFNQFVYLYNQVLQLGSDNKDFSAQQIASSLSQFMEEHKMLRSPSIHSSVMKCIDKLVLENLVTAEEADILRTLDAPTRFAAAPDNEEQTLADQKFKIAGLIHLYSNTRSKMILSHIKRELDLYKGAFDDCERISNRRVESEPRRMMIHDQMKKGATVHLAAVTHQHQSLAKTVTKLHVSAGIKKALVDHIEDLHSFHILSKQLKDFAIQKVAEEDFFLVCACYKYVSDDHAFAAYLELKVSSLDYDGAKRVAHEKRLMERATSYKTFLQERADVYAELQSKKVPSMADSPHKKKSLAIQEDKSLDQNKSNFVRLYEEMTKGVNLDLLQNAQ